MRVAWLLKKRTASSVDGLVRERERAAVAEPGSWMELLSLVSKLDLCPLAVLQGKIPLGPKSIFPIGSHYKRDICKLLTGHQELQTR